MQVLVGVALSASSPTNIYAQEIPTLIVEQVDIPDFSPVATAIAELPPEPPKPKIVRYAAGDCEAYRPLVEKYNWDVEIAMRVMEAESGCNPEIPNLNDYHRSVDCWGSYGLFQLDCSQGKVIDPEKNIEIAYRVKYLNGGWYAHWGVCISGKVVCR